MCVYMGEGGGGGNGESLFVTNFNLVAKCTVIGFKNLLQTWASNMGFVFGQVTMAGLWLELCWV